MTIQELATIFQSHVCVKIVLLNNSFLGMVRQWQELFYDRRYSSTEMVNPDFGLTPAPTESNTAASSGAGSCRRPSPP